MERAEQNRYGNDDWMAWERGYAGWEVEYAPALPEPPRRPPRRRRRRRRRSGTALWFLCLLLACVAAVFGLSCAFRAACHALSQTSEEAGALEGGYILPRPEETDKKELTSDEKFKQIMDHPEEYPEDLRELAVKNAEAMDYVYQYPQLHDCPQDIDLSAEAEGEEVPLLLQWDARWGYLAYGSGLIGYTGCGPTCLSMVALYLTGDASATPAAIAAYAEAHGYYAAGSGTMWSLMSEGCAAFGLSSSELSLDENRMRSALDRGQPLICAMGPGDFTDGGHFIVITGCAEDGFTVNDPNSPRRSGKIWSFDKLRGQIKNIWAFSANETAFSF